MRIRSTLTTTATLGAAAVLTAGCLSEGGGGGGGSGNTSNTIEVMYAFAGEQEAGFQAEVEAWAAENDVTVEFSQTGNFNQLINTRVQGNDAPDVALFPQPGIMTDLAGEGLLADLTDVVDQADLDAMIPGALETGQVDGTQYAVPMSINVKSIVFYPKGAAEAAGLTEPPATLEDLQALTEGIAATGTTPWCFGIESEAATGWPATDWVENLMLINYGSETYNEWVNHEIPFNDPQVVDVLEQMEGLLLEEGRTNGGRQSIASSNFNTAANPMFDEPPGCYMYRQGNFVATPGNFPDDVIADIDNQVGVFPMPGLTAEDKPVLGGGDLAGIFSQENESAQKLVQFLSSAEFGTNGYAENGTWFSARTDFDTSLYANEVMKSIGDIAYSSTEFVFDGSDQMPGEVGSGSFWREMTAYISGGTDAKTALDNIEASWPQ
ncbi:carbohydrate ABC transporter substrate-binding protein [Blastococcus sp. CT_GayMR19]|uniref:ABC transporter substrate-binding protein n=1 Tax=Blastococcus sp. CT_GayMR19 TaxID=2559608 RepID=UPI001072EFB4|nr:ABC transporter substrate-binding protein [Blastococcus sp. CT_GayMR19]TFV75394.1 carbohydrate ABC transporter substrate-binding protein [Blastococcus sp. CT_GayMR19]